MKKHLLALLSLMALANGMHAMELPPQFNYQTFNAPTLDDSFNYQTYGFNVPTLDLSVGQIFTINNVPLEVHPEPMLFDNAGKIWALKNSAGKGFARYQVIAKKALSNQEIISVIKALASALENNNISAMASNLKKLPIKSTVEFQNLLKSLGLQQFLTKACNTANPATQVATANPATQVATANPATQVAFQAALTVTVFKNKIKQKYHTLDEDKLSQLTLEDLVKTGPICLQAIAWLLEQEKVKDSGRALEIAIQNRFFDAAVLLVSHGAKITEFAKSLAYINATCQPEDSRYEKLFKIFGSFEQ